MESVMTEQPQEPEGRIQKLRNAVLREGSRLRLLVRLFMFLLMLRVSLLWAGSGDIPPEQVAPVALMIEDFAKAVFIALVALFDPAKADSGSGQ